MAHPSWGKFKANARATGMWARMTRPMQQGAWKVYDQLDRATEGTEREELDASLTDEEKEGAGLFLQFLRHSGLGRVHVD